MRDDELAVVQDEVGDQSVAEVLHLRPKLRRLVRELRERLGQAMCHLDVPALQGLDELVLVVARYAQGVAAGDHAHHQAQDARRVRTAVDEIADEDGRTRRRVGVDRAALLIVNDGVAELGQQCLELTAAAVHVADDVERPVQMAEVVQQPLADDDRVGDLLLAAQDVDLAEALLAEVLERASQLVALARDDVIAEGAVGPGGVAVQADALGQVEHDRDRQHVVRAGERDEGPARIGLHVRRVDDCQAAGVQSLAGDVVQHVEGRRGRRLVVLVIRHQAAAEVAGEHLEAAEVLPRERRLARAAGADQAHQGQLGDRQLGHDVLLKTAIWVGGPTSMSSSPTGR